MDHFWTKKYLNAILWLHDYIFVLITSSKKFIRDLRSEQQLKKKDSVNNKLVMKTCLKSNFESFLCQLSSLHSIENKWVEVYCKIILSWTDCKSKCTKKCLCIINLNKKLKKLLPQKYGHKQKRFNLLSY